MSLTLNPEWLARSLSALQIGGLVEPDGKQICVNVTSEFINDDLGEIDQAVHIEALLSHLQMVEAIAAAKRETWVWSDDQYSCWVQAGDGVKWL